MSGWVRGWKTLQEKSRADAHGQGEGILVQYVMLFYFPPEHFTDRVNEQDEAAWSPWRTYVKALDEAGVRVAGAPLQPDSTGTTVRIRGGQRHVQDGPYADTKEQLGGFIILELPSLDAALEWAARCPAAVDGAVEIRPVADRVRELVEGC